MLRPMVSDESDEVAAEAAEEEEVAVVEAPANPTKDTFARAADWLRRLGKIPSDSDEPRQSATIGETVQAARKQASGEPPVGGEAPALPIFADTNAMDHDEPARPSSRGQRRFVLKVSDGRQFTIGDIPGGIGSQEDHPSPDGGPWQWVHLPGEESVDPVHLYFGSENGVLWVADRQTAFGTVVSEPGQEPVTCVGEEKYFVIRGSEIRLGGLRITIH